MRGGLGIDLHLRIIMENTLVRENLKPVELSERSLVALNKIRAFVVTLGEVERRERNVPIRSNDYLQDELRHVSSDVAGT